MMPPPFNKYDYLKLKDLRRSPYVIFTPAEVKWFKQDRFRMLLIALDRYADRLKKNAQQTLS